MVSSPTLNALSRSRLQDRGRQVVASTGDLVLGVCSGPNLLTKKHYSRNLGQNEFLRWLLRNHLVDLAVAFSTYSPHSPLRNPNLAEHPDFQWKDYLEYLTIFSHMRWLFSS